MHFIFCLYSSLSPVPIFIYAISTYHLCVFHAYRASFIADTI